jgi:hypothetical protein
LADNARTKIRLLMPGLRCLNSIRNQLAHRLDSEFDEKAIEPMRTLISAWYSAAGKPIPTGIGIVEEFALTAGSWLFGDASMIKRHSPSGGIVGLLAWYDDTGGHQPDDDEV